VHAHITAAPPTLDEAVVNASPIVITSYAPASLMACENHRADPFRHAAGGTVWDVEAFLSYPSSTTVMAVRGRIAETVFADRVLAV
jgi:hypothetical protein